MFTYGGCLSHPLTEFQEDKLRGRIHRFGKKLCIQNQNQPEVRLQSSVEIQNFPLRRNGHPFGLTLFTLSLSKTTLRLGPTNRI